MRLIGIAGKAGAGKDTVADYLVETFGFRKASFADALKTGLAAMGFPEPLERALKEEIIPGFEFSWRQAAQQLGTEWGRRLDPDIWTKITAKRLKRAGIDTVIADVRFENEAAMIREMGGQVWHVVGRQVDLGANAGHVSEAGILYQPTQDAIITNSGSLVNLYAAINAAYRSEVAA